jgi:malonate-semialdehyde dehydrogenase (acetylating)/methylmalonate-semialdehyde dehydrogenase
MTRISHWIDNQAVPQTAGPSAVVTNPATGAVIREVPFADAAMTDCAVAAATHALPGWRDTTPLRRARILMRYRELLEASRPALINAITEEHGKTRADAAGSLQRGIEVVEFATGIPHLLKGGHAENVGRDVDSHTRLQAVGVCAGITPFNFPAMVPMWMYPVALACGNTFILKPSEKVPSTALLLAALLAEAGCPPGVFNVLHGGPETVDALLTHPGIAAVSSVGSTPVARHIYETAARHGKRVQALGGAKNHAVVMPDADLSHAVKALIGAGYGSAGERCMAISAVVAVGGIADALVAQLAAETAKLRIGPGDAPETDMGPLITREHRDRVRGLVDSGVQAGATLVHDGRGLTVPGHGNGFFLGPCLFDHVTPDMPIYQQEIFGPVLCVLRVPSLDEAIALIHACPFANGTAIFTRSGAAARHFERSIEVGMVGINVPIPVPMAYFSFGGWKSSLFGDLHVHGVEAVQFYTRTKTVTSSWPEESSAHAASLNMPVQG